MLYWYCRLFENSRKSDVNHLTSCMISPQPAKTYLAFSKDLCTTALLKVTEQVRGSNFSKIVIFGVHNVCGVGFPMQKKESEISFHYGVIVSFLFCMTHDIILEFCHL